MKFEVTFCDLKPLSESRAWGVRKSEHAIMSSENAAEFWKPQAPRLNDELSGHEHLELLDGYWGDGQVEPQAERATYRQTVIFRKVSPGHQEAQARRQREIIAEMGEQLAYNSDQVSIAEDLRAMAPVLDYCSAVERLTQSVA